MQDDLTVVVGTGALFQDLINGVGAVGRELSSSSRSEALVITLTSTQL